MDDTQYGFRPGRSTTSKNFNLQQISDKSRNYGTDVFAFFVDVKTASTVGSTDSRFSAANIASSGKGLRHALDRLQLRAANGTKIGTR